MPLLPLCSDALAQLVTGRRWAGTAFGGYKSRTGVPELVTQSLKGKLPIEQYITHRFQVPIPDRMPECVGVEHGSYFLIREKCLIALVLWASIFQRTLSKGVEVDGCIGGMSRGKGVFDASSFPSHPGRGQDQRCYPRAPQRELLARRRHILSVRGSSNHGDANGRVEVSQ